MTSYDSVKGWRVVFFNAIKEQLQLGPQETLQEAISSARNAVYITDIRKPFVYYGVLRKDFK